MSFKTKIIATVFGIAAFDAVASFLSRMLQFEYTKLMWVSFLIYVVVGYWGAHRRGFVYGMFLATLAGFSDSTIGWFISRMIGPFLQNPVQSFGPVLVLLTVFIVITLAFVFGSFGAVLCKLLGQTRTADA